jgi:hypothetical protein
MVKTYRLQETPFRLVTFEDPLIVGAVREGEDMGKSNNRKDMHDYADDYEDYGDYRDMGSGMGRYDAEAETDMDRDMAPAEPELADAQLRRASGDTAPASTAIKAKMSSHQAKQKVKRGNQTDR